MTSLHELVQCTAPGGPGSNLSAVRVDSIPVVLTETSVEINLVNSEPAGSLPGVSDSPEDKDDGNSKALLEEVLGITNTALARRADGSENLGSQNNSTEEDTHPGAVDTTTGFEGDQVERAALVSPGFAEADVALGEFVSI